MDEAEGEERVLLESSVLLPGPWPFGIERVRGVKEAGRRRVQPGPKLGELGREFTLTGCEFTERESTAENGSDWRYAMAA